MSVGCIEKPMTRNLETRAALLHIEGKWQRELKCIQLTKQKPRHQEERAEAK